jgi:hypothetical protein
VSCLFGALARYVLGVFLCVLSSLVSFEVFFCICVPTPVSHTVFLCPYPSIIKARTRDGEFEKKKMLKWRSWILCNGSVVVL